MCGDGVVDSAGGETCDTGEVASKGWVDCALVSGWVCPVPGSACFRRNCSAQQLLVTVWIIVLSPSEP